MGPPLEGRRWGQGEKGEVQHDVTHIAAYCVRGLPLWASAEFRTRGSFFVRSGVEYLRSHIA